MDAHQTSIYVAILISGSIIGVIILYFVFSVLYHQRRSNALYKLSIKSEITTLEKERSRIAADLHDELGPVLSAIKYKVGSLDTHSTDDEDTVDKINKHIDKLVQRMREISNDLMPNILIHKGVVFAIRDIIDNLSKPAPLTISFAHQDIPDLPHFESIHIYRIILEIIHNTIKHANAATLKIEFRYADNCLMIQTKDDGDGFDYNQKTRESSRLGLRNILNRTEMLGGNVVVESGRGKGTAYIIEIPYNLNHE